MLPPGTRLGAYEIESLAGSGGMGEVYRGRDTRLDRPVAIKILSQVSPDAQARERFEREARTISRLDHPHICALHDIGRHGETAYLILEFLDGETLDKRLARGPLPLDQVVRIASQIADALHTAHRQHIVHRDLKPGNVMLTKAGAKLLDFGLAKPSGAIAAAPAAPSFVATEAASLTAQGTILGTLQYMSPEQLEGRDTDARTDVFAFGMLLYEMATRRRAFEGKSHASLIAAILEHDPIPITELQPLAPPLLDHVVRRCLQKDPDKRWQSIQDVAFALQAVSDARASTATAQAEPPQRGLAWRFAAGALAIWSLIATVGAIALWTASRQPPIVSTPSIRFAIDTPPAFNPPGGSPTVSMAANGSVIAYPATVDGTRQWYVRRLTEPHSVLLPGAESAANMFVSPDGKSVAFAQGGVLRRMSLEGGAPVTIATVNPVRGLAWGADDTMVFSRGTDSGLWRVSASGGNPVTITTPDVAKGERTHRWPYLLPNGAGILYTTAKSDIISFDDGTIAVHDLRTGESKELVRGGSYPMYSPTGHLLYARAGMLIAAPFDLNRLEITGPPITVLKDVVTYPGTGAAQMALSDTGVLVSMPGGVTEQHTVVHLVDRQGRATEVPFAPGLTQRVRVAPDGRSLALDIDNANASIWIGDMTRATATRLTLSWSNNFPIWSPDGSRVAFTSGRGGALNLFWQPVDGAQPERLTDSDHSQSITSWSSDGRYLLFNDQTASAPRDIFVMDLHDQRKTRPLIQTAFDEAGAEFSPDAKWIAYVSNEGGRGEIYIQSFPDLKRKTLVSRGGGTQPIWAKSGRELYYRNADALMAVDVETAPALAVGAPKELFRWAVQYPSFDVTADGRFVMIGARPSTNTSVPLEVTTDFFSALRSRP